jgi:glyoxylase-like metal-dependent hydrolase (beta-lactamase superfamily II)
VVTGAGVVVLDTGGSLQIGQMAIRMIRQVTHKPVVAVFNSHYHGDHWLGNHAFAEGLRGQLPIYALPTPWSRSRAWKATCGAA